MYKQSSVIRPNRGPSWLTQFRDFVEKGHDEAVSPTKANTRDLPLGGKIL